MEVATEMSSSIYESKTAKKVYLYRNGVVNSEPKCLIVNQRQVRDFGSFLNRVTSGLKAPVAIRNIYTPAAGHKVKSLDSLESGRYYVAGGSEQFKKIKYGSSSPQKLLARRPPRKELSIPSRLQQAIVAEARYKKPVEKPFIIHVFRNGDFRYRGARVLLPRRIMGSWEHVLEIVTEKADLFTPAKRLCTLDGHVVHAVSELQDGGKYVAIEGTKPFQRVAYCATDDSRSLMHTFPKATFHLQRGPRRKPLHLAHKDVPGDSVVSDPGKTPVPPLSQTLRQRQLDKRKTRPMAGRKNKEAREKAIQDHRADSIFGGSPTRDLDTSIEGPLTKNEVSSIPHPLSTSVNKDTEADTVPAERKPGVFCAVDNNKQKELKQTAEYTEDTQGDTVFKAKAQRAELEEAEVVAESHDTEVEQPIDLEEAEEVEEERAELAEEGGATVSQSQEEPHGQPHTQPLHTSIDLSVNRAQPSTSATSEDETDSKTTPAEQIMPSPKSQSGSPKVVRGSATSVRSRHSDTNNGAISKPESTQQNQEESRKMSEGERSILESTGETDEAVAEDISNDINGGGDVEDSNPPPVEEEIEEDIPETQEQHQPTTDEAEGDVEPKDNDDPVEEVPEEVQDEHVSPPPVEPEPLEEEQPTEVEEGEPTITTTTGNGEPEVMGPTTEDVDIGTSVQEEIVEEVDTSVQDDDTGSSHKEDEPTTTFLVEDIQPQST